MRFMLIMFPENYPTAKAGWVPDLTDIEDSRKFHEEMGAAGVLQALDGLTPPATMSARVTRKNGKVESYRRPVYRNEGSGRRLLHN